MITKAPLPFRGQKSQWAKIFAERVSHITNVHTYIDLFGGSGLLAHWCKRLPPSATVIYNDYDNYSERLKHIVDTNLLLCQLRDIVSCDCRVISNEQKQKIMALLQEREQQNKFVDYITLSAGLLFSGKYATNYKDLVKNTFYNTIPKQLYSATGYLDGITVIKADYKQVIADYNAPGVCFLVDPPYLSTACSTYKSVEYWGLADYLNVCKALAEMDNFIYFSSDRSQIVELFNFMQNNFNASNPFASAEKYVKLKQISSNTNGYEDTMYVQLQQCNSIKTPLKLAI